MSPLSTVAMLPFVIHMQSEHVSVAIRGEHIGPCERYRELKTLSRRHHPGLARTHGEVRQITYSPCMASRLRTREHTESI